MVVASPEEIVVERAGRARPWRVLDAGDKLRARTALPGAHVYDRCAHVLRALQADGADGLALVPLTLPASWLVNARASSRAMRAWLGHEAWRPLLEVLAPSLAPDEWLALDAASRARCEEAVVALASVGHGAGLASVSKVLALLRPQLVPLMDDAAIAFALGAVPPPETADEPMAPASLFAPMLDWFARAVLANERALVALAAAHEEAPLDAAQVLDRLVWFDSWGWRADARFATVDGGDHEGVALAPRASR